MHWKEPISVTKTDGIDDKVRDESGCQSTNSIINPEKVKHHQKERNDHLQRRKLWWKYVEKVRIRQTLRNFKWIKSDFHGLDRL